MHHSKKNKKLHKLIAVMVSHPARIIEMIMGLWIGWLIYSVSMEWGGDLVAGAGLVRILWMTIVLLGLQVIWWFLHHDVVRVRKSILWAVPVVVWLSLQPYLVTGTAWRAELVAAVALAAFSMLWVVSCSIRSRVGIWTTVSSVCVALLCIVVVGVYQYFVRPDWSPEMINLNRPEAIGMTGAFIVPVHFAAIFVLFFPFFVMGALMTRFAGYVRIALGAMGLFSLYTILMSGSWGVLSVLILEFLLIPLLVSPKLLIRFKLWFYGFALILTYCTFAVNTNFTIRSKVVPSYEMAPLPIDGRALSQGLEGWESAPVWGLGLRSFDLRNGGEAERGITVLLAELGGIGFVVVGLIGGAWILFTWWRLARLPYAKKDHESEYRREINRELTAEAQRKEGTVKIKTSGKGDRRKKRKRKHKSFGLPPTSTARIFGGGLLVGLIGVFALVWIETLQGAGLLLILVAIAFSMVETILSGAEWMNHSRARIWSMLMGVVSLLLIGLLSSRINLAEAQHYYFMGEQALVEVRKNPEDSFLNPAPVFEAQSWADKALGLNERHGDAIRLKGEAILNELYVARKPAKEIGAAALTWADRGLALGEDQWEYFLIKAQALELVKAENTVITEHFEKALELAPKTKRIYVDYLSYLVGVRDRALLEKAKSLIVIGLEQFPQDAELESLKLRLEL